jgi:hypothetical protein
MGLMDKVKKAFKTGKIEEVKEVPKQEKNSKKTPKEIATKKGEPWVDVISMELDPNNPGNGAFELDWNEQFIKRLWKAGYKDDDESDMVDRWFQDVCRNVVLETYENDQADPEKRKDNRKDLGGGRTEIS